MDFEHDDAKQKYALRFASGDLLNVVLFVKVSALGQEGTDILCGCHVSTEQDMLDMMSDYDMIGNAMLELSGNISSFLTELKDIGIIPPTPEPSNEVELLKKQPSKGDK
jgi:hypothetical protein